jgi:hypothetical protein
MHGSDIALMNIGPRWKKVGGFRGMVAFLSVTSMLFSVIVIFMAVSDNQNL